ncbi:hypothetical protein UFOVP1522_20 [uncultured Caudovirales phage]|uniref:Uncharacterized protein n=1 Tax=uncultured Caudovirales phage TaxID=2100421 RepID=A0A6J7XBS5_9CAUD|nr:hypothetical protein UFOVP989_3 [uncultured Caudovirales phage]CAB4181737.1 hypothetical protein UFOVP1075_63 [uncultured Caudovirales phage]CAB4198764.1 hypothetical protein UFOVP1312_55 [uncultured Caudovirales phage]CAB4210341.1 hypothetical protein UFOVP1426_3 [uncultured Caudovirales phage]CAB5227266.1 hypothetical protein UFOVP1522_20 [uncultured Caudovirales phage]
MSNKGLSQASKEDTQIAVMANDISYIKKSIDDLSLKVDHNYVTKDEFDPIKKLVYGMVAVVLSSVVATLMTILVKK